MNTDSKASIRFEAFFFDGEDGGKNDIDVSFDWTVTCSNVPAVGQRAERIPECFDTGLENVARCSIYFRKKREKRKNNCQNVMTIAPWSSDGKAKRGDAARL